MVATRLLPAPLAQRARPLRATWSTSPTLLVGITAVSLLRATRPRHDRAALLFLDEPTSNLEARAGHYARLDDVHECTGLRAAG